MSSFQITISPTRRAAARFITGVRRALQLALIEESKKRGLTQSDIARELGVHRSVINRELRGDKDMTMGRVGELAFLLGRKPVLLLPEKKVSEGSNHVVDVPQYSVQVTSTASTTAILEKELETQHVAAA